MTVRIKCADCGGALGFMGGVYAKVACIPDYDAGKPERTKSGKRVIRFDGDATYQVVNRCEYGAGYHCRLIRSKPNAIRSRVAYKARVAALCR